MGRMLSYDEIVDAHLAPVVAEKLTRRLRKLGKLAPIVPAVEWVQIYIAKVRMVISIGAPIWLLALTPEDMTRPMVEPFRVHDYRLEAFVYRMYEERYNKVPTGVELVSVAKEGPYRGCMDIEGFQIWLAEGVNTEKYRGWTTSELRIHAATVTLIYAVIMKMASGGSPGSVRGVFFDLFFMYTGDLPKLYSMLNLMYWHSTGRSSPTISGLMPKDPYDFPKKLSRVLVCLLPTHFLRHIPTSLMAKVVPFIAESLAKVRTFPGLARVPAEIGGYQLDVLPWATVARQVWAAIDAGDPYSSLGAPTSTGKSTAFIAALHTERPRQKFWLLLPRVINKEEYTNTHFRGTIVRLERGAAFWTFDLVVSTYGQFLARYNAIDPADWFLIMDEYHEGSAEMIVTDVKTRGWLRLGLSGTPRSDLFPTMLRHFETGIRRPFSVKVKVIPKRISEIFQHAWQEHGAGVNRCLIIVPSLRAAEEIAQSLRLASFEATVVSRHRRHIPTTGIIVTSQQLV
eukprot:GHVR01086275.1.p1 GENE.GHVR01086275.1~~GHVR01086275.1.p1  ORF type:complete len:512 (+),score=41.87 GHVR01086275.1:507-2042(+)